MMRDLKIGEGEKRAYRAIVIDQFVERLVHFGFADDVVLRVFQLVDHVVTASIFRSEEEGRSYGGAFVAIGRTGMTGRSRNDSRSSE